MTTYHVELKDRQRLFGKVRLRGGVPHWPDGEPLSGVDISYWACWRTPKVRRVPKPGEAGFQRHSRLEGWA
jgi:hypothetical protein